MLGSVHSRMEMKKYIALTSRIGVSDGVDCVRVRAVHGLERE